MARSTPAFTSSTTSRRRRRASSTRAAPPRAHSLQDGVDLARLLRAAGHDAVRIQERLAPSAHLRARSPDLPPYLRRLGDADELALLIRLFLLGVPVAHQRCDALVGA